MVLQQSLLRWDFYSKRGLGLFMQHAVCKQKRVNTGKIAKGMTCKCLAEKVDFVLTPPQHMVQCDQAYDQCIDILAGSRNEYRKGVPQLRDALSHSAVWCIWLFHLSAPQDERLKTEQLSVVCEVVRVNLC